MPLGGGVVEFCVVVFVLIFVLTSLVLAGNENEMGDSVLKLIPETILEICPFELELIGISCA